MDYKHLGRSGLKVSPLCLGTVNFGWQTDEADSHAILDRALDAGINFVDTANVYQRGIVERIIGNWFVQDRSRRDKVVLATKLYGTTGSGPNDSRLSARHIRHACEASLRRLGTEYIDLYQMHHVDRETPWEEIWQAMERLVQDGKVLYVGSSNFAGWHIAQANEAAKRRHFMGLVSEQCIYNLNRRAVETDVIPACQSYGLGVLPYSPLDEGLLVGGLANIDTSGAGDPSVDQDIQKTLSGILAKLNAGSDLVAIWQGHLGPALVNLMDAASNTPDLSRPLNMRTLAGRAIAAFLAERGGDLSTEERDFFTQSVEINFLGPGERKYFRDVRAKIEKQRDQLIRHDQFCADAGLRPAEVALAWLLHQPAVTAPIIGPRTIGHLESALRAVEIKFSDEQLKALDDIWPGPGGPAPESFAW